MHCLSASYPTPLRQAIKIACVGICLLLQATAASAAAALATETPIEHLIIVVGENISFDNLFATTSGRAASSIGRASPGRTLPGRPSGKPAFAIALP